MRHLLLLPLLLGLASCTAIEPTPKFSLKFPVATKGKTQLETFRRGASLALGDPTFEDIRPALKPTTRLSGAWGNSSWCVEVLKGVSEEILPVLQKPTHGKGLSNAGIFLGSDLTWTINASPIIAMRISRKSFIWGEGVSFLIQYQNDSPVFGLNNDMLCYEVHGVSSDQRYTIRARFGITHPQLPEDARTVRKYFPKDKKWESRMKRDPSYILVESCPDFEFQPSISEIDRILNTLKIE